MKLGVMAALFAKLSFLDAVKYCQRVGLDAIELPAGGYPGDQWDLLTILQDKQRLATNKKILDDHGIKVIGIACHGNPIHPNKTIANAHIAAHDNAIRLAGEFGTDVVINFSGCPGGCEGDKTPNFVTCPWPDEFGAASKYQWDRVMIPFWSKKNGEAEAAGVKIAFEAHPGMVVHTPEDIIRLRKAAGKNLGANIDPSHWFWQGIDPIAATRTLGAEGCIFHVHGKDVMINPFANGTCGVLDVKDYGKVLDRGWYFVTVGCGHGNEFWVPFIYTLDAYGYNGVVSIEHEDGQRSANEGFEFAVDYLKRILIREKPGTADWHGKDAAKAAAAALAPAEASA